MSISTHPRNDGSHVVIVGGGIAGLTAALTCAKQGHRVTLLEASDSLGGLVARHTLGGHVLDAGAESFAVRGGRVAPFLEELGIADRVVAPNSAGAWLFRADASGRTHAAPLPKTGMLGIPAHPLARDVRRIVGLPSALWAATDRWRKADASLGTLSLGQVVQKRLGRRVLERLVTPVVGGVYSADPHTLPLETVAKGLREQLSETGSLTRAVSALTAGSTPGSAVRGVAGGNLVIVDALAKALAAFGAAVELRTGHPVSHIQQTTDGWMIDGTVAADAVLLTCPVDAAAHILGSLDDRFVPDRKEPTATRIDTILVDQPGLDSAPRGTGMLIGNTNGTVKAKALTHVSAKWAWVREGLPPGQHVIRLSYRADAATAANGVIERNPNIGPTLRDASLLLGVQLSPATLIDSDTVTWVQRQATPASVHNLHTALASYPTLGVAGSWVSGTGLASAIPGAIDTAERLCNSLPPKGTVPS
ncbi:FAD-dependent oxidoreductase [Lysinibacter cavernae]|uniref:Oxygen-dependent protoporphyrinogen oxidase n=1 Tax=Lysinibacter cavernae TaxID=1640652 RepID=A0A7X5R2C4_9MICO|nr:oxygen-dependent protoporphyrinogen oxidase [Lysinibacter cavernae]